MDADQPQDGDGTPQDITGSGGITLPPLTGPAGKDEQQ